MVSNVNEVFDLRFWFKNLLILNELLFIWLWWARFSYDVVSLVVDSYLVLLHSAGCRNRFLLEIGRFQRLFDWWLPGFTGLLGAVSFVLFCFFVETGSRHSTAGCTRRRVPKLGRLARVTRGLFQDGRSLLATKYNEINTAERNQKSFFFFGFITKIGRKAPSNRSRWSVFFFAGQRNLAYFFLPNLSSYWRTVGALKRSASLYFFFGVLWWRRRHRHMRRVPFFFPNFFFHFLLCVCVCVELTLEEQKKISFSTHEVRWGVRIDRVLLNLFGKPSKKKTSNGQSFAISSFRELGKIVFKFGKLFFHRWFQMSVKMDCISSRSLETQ